LSVIEYTIIAMLIDNDCCHMGQKDKIIEGWGLGARFTN